MTTLGDRDLTSFAVVLAANEGYALPLAVALSSLLQHASTPPQIIIADCGLSTGTRCFLDRLATKKQGPPIRFIEKDALTCLTAGSKTRHSPAALARLQLPGLLASEFDFLLYLDSDVLVRADPLSIMLPEGESSAIHAVIDAGGDHIACKTHLLVLDVSPDSLYFNTGVLLIDVQRWVSQEIGEKALLILREYASRLVYPDQDALNVVLNGSWRQIDPRWNVQLDTIWSKAESLDPRFKAASSDAAIWHYISPRKPWHVGKLRPERIAWLLHALHVCAGGGWFGLRGVRWLVEQYARSGVRRLLARR